MTGVFTPVLRWCRRCWQRLRLRPPPPRPRAFTLGVERLEPPREYVDRLTRAGGTNLYGEPNFILFWGQTHVPRAINPACLLGENRPCWNLGMWRPPEDWGSPEDWDDQTLGAYPSQGAYDLLQPFYRSAATPGAGIEAMPISIGLIEAMISIIQAHKGDSFGKRKAAFQAQKDAQEKEQERHIDAVLADARPAFLDAASYRGQTSTRTALQKKIEELERWCPPVPRSRGPFISR